MVKNLLSVALAVAAIFGLSAQAPAPAQQQLTPEQQAEQMMKQPLPLNPNVRAGVLPNGLHYYVLHNEKPKERANFYIAQKVGSTLETPQQLGLAHFLEHMAFNGTTNYPGKNMLNYLEAKGIRFGADINAYTGFDETVYNINNVPTSDATLMDSVLICLRDWSCGILLEESEIDAERGVIEGEWRQRNTAGFRMYETILPQIFQEYQYQQMPIGKMEIVRTFPPQVIRDYYKKWYRPDQQGIIITGDFDAAEMEKKVIALFSTIPMPDGAAARTYPTVSDNKEPIYAYFEDPEMGATNVIIMFKDDKVPFEERNTIGYFLQDKLMLNVFSKMINNRLNDEARKADCSFAYAGVNFGDFMIAKTKASFEVIIIPKSDVEKATREAMAVVTRACKTGFLPSEVTRARDELLASYERAYNERNTTDNDVISKGIIRHFIDNEPAPGAEISYQLAQGIAGVPVEAYNQIGAGILTDENQVMVVARQTKEGQPALEKTVMLGALQEVLHADYVPYEEEKITEPLISQLPAKGSVTASKPLEEFGATEFTLSNGVRVIVKSTDYDKDQIILHATAPGGLMTYPASQAPNLNFIDNAFNSSKIGNYNASTLEKYLAGKKVRTAFGIGQGTNYLQGVTTVKDLPTLMELVYASFTQLTPDPEEWAGTASQLKISLEQQESNPMSIFNQRRYKNMYGNNALTNMPTLADLEKSNYPEMVKIINQATANAANFTFILTGNIDVETLKPLLEQYIATLPATKASVPQRISPITYPAGQLNDTFTLPMATPSSYVFDTFTGKGIEYNVVNNELFSMTGQILDMVFLRTLREEMGGTYGASSWGSISPNTGAWQLTYIFQTNAKQQADMIKRAYDETINLLSKGANADDFAKVKEQELKQFEINEHKNSSWNDWLTMYARGWNIYTCQKAAIESITLKQLNDFMKKQLLPTVKKNQNLTVMEGVEKK